MALHFLDPSREPRGCPCALHYTKGIGTGATHARVDCPDCHGTGRLGEAGARPDVEVWEWDEQVWYYIVPSHSCDAEGPYSTEAAALAAAREAHHGSDKR